ncbi:TonB family protein [Leptolyngbya sp. FACHB-36]|uniref:energy transducer TonB family protein n=1 Tax=Leptolyngbya sp. FACHB-36 TaxID=2692808 RepID=UPI001680F1D1|nr:energy transducer TonB [Leptolyngbya sp. FACHB-36]MBD2022008.1 TonB family protein [Leptolyngbya sp. FACHB-36]
MEASNLASAQRQKEKKLLRTFLLWSALGSVALHAIVLAANPPTFLRGDAVEAEEEIEVVAEPTEPEAAEPDATEPNVPEPEPSPETTAIEEPVQDVAIASIASPEAPPPLPALAPESQAPQPAGEDAPSDKPLPPSSEAVNPLTGTVEALRAAFGGGPISRPGGEGSGFGNAKTPSGFIPGGRPDGKPDGKPGGSPDGKPNGKPGGNPNSTATRSGPPAVPAPAVKPTGPGKPQCVSCPKPRYRGKEGNPGVTYDIAPDGRVVNLRLRRSSGDPDTDRETLEAMSKWRFDPKTVPEGGRQNVRVRVTFEEEGSTFQRQNEQRRQEQQEQRRIAEQEQQRREAEQRSKPAPTTATDSPKPEPVVPVQPAAPASPPPAAQPLPTPSVEATPAPPPVEVAPPPVEPAPVPPPVEAPSPVAPPPAPAEPAPVEPAPEVPAPAP